MKYKTNRLYRIGEYEAAVCVANEQHYVIFKSCLTGNKLEIPNNVCYLNDEMVFKELYKKDVVSHDDGSISIKQSQDFVFHEDGSIGIKQVQELHGTEETKQKHSPCLKHSHYFKDVSKLDKIDVYSVLALFEVTDPCIQHAVKKLLCTGNRGHKDFYKDVQDSIDSLQRCLELRKELGLN